MSKNFNRERSNGEAAGREDSRWKDERWELQKLLQRVVVAAMSELTDEAIAEISDRARRRLRQRQTGIRGQMLMPSDSIEWHVAKETWKLAAERIAELEAERIAELEVERRLMARLLDEWQDNWNSSMMPDGDLIDDTNAMLDKIDAQENSDE